MNDRMEQEIRRTILRLQASMPEPRNRQTPVFTLLRIAAGEINAGLLLGLFAGALIFGLLSVRALSMPMLTIFCTAPMPMLLLFHRYVLASNQNMRELEATFPYSYPEMLAARSVVISCWMFGALLLLTDVQETVDSLISVRDRMAFIFLLALTAVLVLAGLISRIVTRPVAELSGGIERMSKGDYEYRVHVQGKGEMAQLAAAFNQMSEQVHNLDEARNQFVSNASHELKTPLATIKILVESMMYQDDMDPQLRREFLGDIDKEIDRLSSVVGDLLTLVHIDSHKLRLRREMMVLADTVRETAARLGPLAKKRGQQIVVHIQDECEMFADPGKLAQVCYNIIENAIKYTPDGGHIRVTAGSEGETVWMEVADDGIGIPEADRSRIFERFYRVDKARSRESGGTGLGLSIATEIVQRHHGTLTLVDRPGPGTTVRLELPITQPIGGEESHE